MNSLSNSTLNGLSNPIYISKALGVKEYSYCEEMNGSFRNTMEDGHFVIDDFLGDGKSILFGVFDGHGGREVADFVITNFPKEFQSQYSACKKDVKLALEKTFLNVDNNLKEAINSQEVGSTACVGVILFEAGKRVLYIANAGDTRAVIGQMAGYKRVSYDHKASDAPEQARIKKDGGNIYFNRVEGLLAVTRAFGDHLLKDKGVTALPYVEKVELRVIDKFLVVATDGLWDVCNDQDVIEMIKKREGALDMSKTLVSTALKNYSRDNVSVLVLILN